MKLTHQTGIATLVQLIVLSVFALISQVFSVIDTCREDSGDCINNLLISIVFYVLVAVVFGSIWVVGLLAQNSRNKWLAWLLIGIEALVAAVALFSIKIGLQGGMNIPGLLTSLLIAAVALWTITLAFRLTRYQGQRIALSGRRRRRRRPSDQV
ncbi:MAG TPA: hypothetical protein VFX84_01280 [Candidatus Saccharimonadales bacterium]|nr:hypothetical protein [Candidatus Saccharimonadales bacterium]